jgi:hypothetical protein
MLIRALVCLAAALVLAGCASSPAASAGVYSFGVWGDMPYKKASDQARMPAVLSSINASDIAFSIYDGDIKDGSSPCTDATFTEALQMFASLRRPVVYVPGDNEWTDCHRTNNNSYDPLERLAHLRRVMYPGPDSLGQTTLPLEHQGAPGQPYVENTRFSFGPVVFAGLNVPGSNNNRVQTPEQCSGGSQRSAAQCEQANAEYRARDAANIIWMAQTFAQARARGARGVVLVIQADPGFDLPETWPLDESQLPDYSGYRNFMAELVRHTEAFAGQVLLVHGDTHFFKVDKPLYAPNRLLPNFTRLETFGSPSLHWVKVTVDPASEALFLIQPVIVSQPGAGAAR